MCWWHGLARQVTGEVVVTGDVDGVTAGLPSGRSARSISRRRRAWAASVDGQVAMLLLGGLLAIVVGVLVLGAVAQGMGSRDAAQRAADLAALGGARAMQEAYGRLFEPAMIGGRRNPRHLEKVAYLALGRAAAERVAAANEAPKTTVTFPDAHTLAPVRVRVEVERRRPACQRRHPPRWPAHQHPHDRGVATTS